MRVVILYIVYVVVLYVRLISYPVAYWHLDLDSESLQKRAGGCPWQRCAQLVVLRAPRVGITTVSTVRNPHLVDKFKEPADAGQTVSCST